ncbi:MAG: YbaB/EbfC family nucleoid-associated protein [Sphingomonadales bacterium]|nr:YbaB/EbfC family nucleoid-associated protein [Sphingomonadales bacterium]MBL0114204.1 YbaB/EbfC family nucleoid-associated protein [Sphingomonadales bacterium]
MKSLDDIIKMAQNVQEQMGQAQANLDSIEVEGIAGGGLVKIRATAKGRILGVTIDESLLNPSEKQIVEDLIAAAINDARTRADTVSSEEMSKMTSGLPLPPGFKLPF